MELKVRQLEEARCTKQAPGASSTGGGGMMTGRRSLPSTPSEDTNTWNKFNLSKELEEARKQLKLRDQEILQLRAQVSLPPALQVQAKDLVDNDFYKICFFCYFFLLTCIGLL